MLLLCTSPRAFEDDSRVRRVKSDRKRRVRGRLDKSSIGQPKDFVHFKHVDSLASADSKMNEAIGTSVWSSGAERRLSEMAQVRPLSIPEPSIATTTVGSVIETRIAPSTAALSATHTLSQSRRASASTPHRKPVPAPESLGAADKPSLPAHILDPASAVPPTQAGS